MMVTVEPLPEKQGCIASVVLAELPTSLVCACCLVQPQSAYYQLQVLQREARGVWLLQGHQERLRTNPGCSRARPLSLRGIGLQGAAMTISLLALTKQRAASRKMPCLTLTALNLVAPSTMRQLLLVKQRQASIRSQEMPVSPTQTALPCKSRGRSIGWGLQRPALGPLRLGAGLLPWGSGWRASLRLWHMSLLLELANSRQLLLEQAKQRHLLLELAVHRRVMLGQAQHWQLQLSRAATQPSKAACR